MKTKAITLALTGLILSTALPAHAESTPSGLYISGSLGNTWTRDADWSDSGFTGDIDFDNALNVGLALGKEINDRARAEIEISYRNADINTISFSGIDLPDSNGDLKSTAFMLNGYYDLTQDTLVKPYVSAGIGVVRHKIAGSAAGLDLGSDSDTVFAYQIGAGIAKDINEKTAATLGYRYLGSSDGDFGTTTVEYGAHEIRAGLRYSF